MNLNNKQKTDTVNISLTKVEAGELIAEIIRQWILHSQENTDFMLWGFNFSRNEIVGKLHDKMFGKDFPNVKK